ncbi:MAG TPA: hypothetical protein VFG01_02870 [Acidobacteriota bacterium]|nr:hypothetical protein [Acidobacteriota bacterium]
MIENLFSLDKISIYQFSELLDLTREIKERPKHFKNSLSGCTVAGVFQNPSFYTKVSFQVAVSSLKGQPVIMKYPDIQASYQKLSQASCQCLERLVDGIVIEIKSHNHIIELGKTVKIPVINAGSETFSPCQALADFFTIKEHYKDLTDIKLAFIGNQKNICHSLLLASSLAGTYIHIATPPENKPEQEVIDVAEAKGKKTGFNYRITENPQEAVLNANIIYYSYIEPNYSSKSEKEFSFMDHVYSNSIKDVLFMLSLPSKEWEESIHQKIPPTRSLILSQADNRLHITKAIMVSLIKEKKREI